jgi:hypothetical protein
MASPWKIVSIWFCSLFICEFSVNGLCGEEAEARGGKRRLDVDLPDAGSRDHILMPGIFLERRLVLHFVGQTLDMREVITFKHLRDHRLDKAPDHRAGDPDLIYFF